MQSKFVNDGVRPLPFPEEPEAMVSAEWPSLVYLFRPEKFDPYVRSLVRAMGFAAQCEPGHPCLVDETAWFRLREAELRRHIASFQAHNLWDKTEEAVTRYVRRMAVERLNEMDWDAELDEAVRELIERLDCKPLMSPGPT